MGNSLPSVIGQPLVIASISGFLSTIGILRFWTLNEDQPGWNSASFFSRDEISRHPQLSKKSLSGSILSNRNLQLRCARSTLAACLVSAGVLFWTRSIYITLPFTIFAAVITWVHLRNRESNKRGALAQVWPDVIDHLISGLHSGLSLAEAMSAVALRGPQIVRPHFLAFKLELIATGDFIKACENLREQLQSHGSDQILEAVLIAKTLGGSELFEIFRVLGDFLRQDLTLRREIEIKHGWIKNSAHLSAAAPWILLLLLSSQPGTVESFSQSGGLLILASGLAMTFVAYFWMGRLGKLPSAPRVFELSGDA